MDLDKRALAARFINEVRTMEPAALNALIAREAGEELAQFFLSYACDIVERTPERMKENISSLMLMGYLVRANEERGRAPSSGAKA